MDLADLGRSFPSVPTADTERRTPLTGNLAWSPTQLALFGHSISVDITTGNLLVATSDVAYQYHTLGLGAHRGYDAQEQHMHLSYLRHYPNVNPKPHWFGNWRFAHEADVDNAWHNTHPEIHLASGLGINGLFERARPDFKRNIQTAADVRDMLRKYGLPGRTLNALGWAFTNNDFILRTLRGPFQVLTGRFLEETLVDPVEAQLWCFNPASGMGCRITSDYFYNVGASDYRDVGFPTTVAKLVDGLGHAISLLPSGSVPPHRSFFLADDTGRQLHLKLDTPFVFADGLKAGRMVRRYLVSELVDGSRSTHNQLRYAYTSEGLLTEVTYPSSLGTRRIRYHYDSPEFPGVLTSIENSQGDRVTFEYSADPLDNDDRLNPRLKVARIIDPEGVTLAFEYSRSGALVTVSRGGIVDRKVRYEYVRDQANTKQRFVTLTQVDVTRGYSLDPNGVPVTAIPQAIRNRVVYTADGRFNVAKTIDPLGRETKFEYDGFNHIVKQIDVDNHWTKNTYDIAVNPIQYDLVKVEREQLLRAVSTSGQITESVQTVTTSYQYGPYDATTSADANDVGVHSTHRVLSRVDPRQKVWTYKYDDVNNFNPLTPTSVTTPLGNTRTKTYNARGEIIAVTDPEQNAHAYSYTPQGAPQAYTDPNGGVVQLTYYPEASWLHKYVDQNSHVTEFKRDVDGRITSVTNPVGDTIDYEYFKNGRVRKITRHRPPVPTDPQNPASLSLVTPYANLVTEFAFHPLGELASLKSPKGLEIVYAFDENGRLYEWFHRVANPPTVKTVYDAAGQVAHRIDRKAQRVDYTYHNSGHMKSTKYPPWSDGTTVNPGKLIDYKKYDYDGRLLTVADSELPGDTEFVYDPAGNLQLRRDADGFELRFTVDDDNQLTGVADAAGLYAAALVNDTLGRARAITDSAWLDGSLRWDYSYQRVAGSTRYALNLYGINLPAVSLTSAFDYDAKNRLVAIDHAWGGNPSTTIYSQTLRCRNDDVIDVIGGDDADSFRYDSLKQLVFETNAKLVTDYDQAGNRLSRVKRPAGGTPAQNTHDQLNRLLTDTGVPATFTYDVNGNMASATHPWNPTLYSFDGMGLLRTVSSSQYKINYVYDRMGRLVRRLVETIAAGTHELTSFRFAFSKPVIVERGGNPILLLTWGPDGRLLRSRHSQAVSAGTYPHSLFALYDGLGSLVRIVDGQRNRAVRASYDPWGKMTLVDPRSLLGFWSYKNGLTDGLTGSVLFGARWYLPEVGRWCSEDPSVGAGLEGERFEVCNNLYAYALNSPVNLVDPTGLEADSARPAFEFPGMSSEDRTQFLNALKTISETDPWMSNALDIVGGQDFPIRFHFTPGRTSDTRHQGAMSIIRERDDLFGTVTSVDVFVYGQSLKENHKTIDVALFHELVGHLYIEKVLHRWISGTRIESEIAIKLTDHYMQLRAQVTTRP